ncbi:MAG: FixH family protein [Anaerolineales bacterium]|nr:FixH family protein [Anaerolineales bacterium]
MNTKRIFARMIAALVLAVLAAGCSPAGAGAFQSGGTEQEPAPTLSPAENALAPSTPTLGGSQRSGDVLGWLSSTPAQPVVGTAEMDVFLIDGNQQPITDAKVTFDTDMTNAGHGEYLVSAEPAGDGHYRGPIHYSMQGPWRVIAIVERPGQEIAKLRFDFRVTTEQESSNGSDSSSGVVGSIYRHQCGRRAVALALSQQRDRNDGNDDWHDVRYDVRHCRRLLHRCSNGHVYQ